MKKLQVKHSGGWDLKNGGRVDYYDVGDWSMELIEGQLYDATKAAKHAIKTHKAWYKFLKKQAKKNPRH